MNRLNIDADLLNLLSVNQRQPCAGLYVTQLRGCSYKMQLH